MQALGWVLMRRWTFLAAPCLCLGNQTAAPVWMHSRDQGPLACSGGASHSLRWTDGHLGDLCIPMEHSSVLRLPKKEQIPAIKLAGEVWETFTVSSSGPYVWETPLVKT